ncbi:MAG: Penicillin-binding protein 2 [Serratia liquefaciens]|jgi:penicillin-binding protein 2
MKIERNPFRDYTAESALFVRRALVAFLVILVLTGTLIANLYNLQIVRFEDYRTRSNENRIKLVPIAPSRGIIYDRNGTPLALNRTIYQLELMPEKVDDLKATLQALRSVVDLTDDDITNFEKERKRSRRFVSIPVKTALSEVQVARFAVNQFRFPGVEVKGYQRRYYPYGSALTHVIGYVSKINDRDVERLDKDGKLANYAATHDIGKLGIERYYEETLHGKTGYEEVEVNNRGRVIRQLHEQPPSAGKDVYLTLDLNLQRYIEQLLVGSRAAVVVSDPRTGGILAMVSNPSYDPNLFVDGISSKDYQGSAQRSEPAADQPCHARALPTRLHGEAVYFRFGAQRRGDHQEHHRLRSRLVAITRLGKTLPRLEKMGPRPPERHQSVGRVRGYLLLSGRLRHGHRSPVNLADQVRLRRIYRHRSVRRAFRPDADS